jgi:translation initiation factor 2 gamma subunit (eIF-2gamma)
MTNLTSHLEPGQTRVIPGSTAFKTERNQHEVRCGMCGNIFYVDEGVYAFAKEGMETGLDNPFKCETCEQEYDELSYEG